MFDHPIFAEALVDGLVNQFLDELIPDVLIDTLNSIGKMVGIVPPLVHVYMHGSGRHTRDLCMHAFIIFYYSVSLYYL